MKSPTLLLLLATCILARAELPYALPPKAKYTASAEAIAQAKSSLAANLAGDAAALAKLFAKPVLCGPGLWNVVKGSPHFARPPVAKSTAKIPIENGKFLELPMAFFQTDEEVASFRQALADLLASQGTLTVREPGRGEFMKYWAVIPFDEITGPLLVAEGKDATIFCQFEKGTVLWVDEVKRPYPGK